MNCVDCQTPLTRKWAKLCDACRQARIDAKAQRPRCRKCNKLLLKVHESGFCHECRRTEMTDITCQKCGVVYQVRVNTVKYGHKSGLCWACGTEDRLGYTHEMRAERERAGWTKSDKDSIRMNGCTLVPSKAVRKLPGCLNNLPVMAPRCPDYTVCIYGMYADVLEIPEERQCMNIVAQRLWFGWTVAEQQERHVMTDEQIQAVREHELGSQVWKEQIDWLYG